MRIEPITRNSQSQRCYYFRKKMSNEYCICVDGMKPTVDFYKSHLSRKYNIKGGFFMGTHFIQDKTYQFSALYEFFNFNKGFF